MKMGLYDVLPAESLDGLTAEDFRLLLNGVNFWNIFWWNSKYFYLKFCHYYFFSGWWYQRSDFNRLHFIQWWIRRKSWSTRSHQKMVVVDRGKNVSSGETRLGVLLDWISCITRFVYILSAICLHCWFRTYPPDSNQVLELDTRAKNHFQTTRIIYWY